MNKLCYPTLDLFIYDLKSYLSASQTETNHNRQAFQSRLNTTDNNLQWIEIEQEDPESGYQTLLTPNFLKQQVEKESFNLEGYLYPVLLNNTYGLLANLTLRLTIKPKHNPLMNPFLFSIRKLINIVNLILT
ncbi:MAG: hypothetical protein AB4041_14715 [Microcystaceae cyanobacterium]